MPVKRVSASASLSGIQARLESYLGGLRPEAGNAGSRGDFQGGRRGKGQVKPSNIVQHATQGSADC